MKIYGLLLFVFLTIGYASPYIKILAPVQGTLFNNQSIYVGKIAPGETFYLSADANTTNYNGSYVTYGWNLMKPINLPNGWIGAASKLYENPLIIKITVSSNASYGIYKIPIEVINIGNYSKVGNLTFYAIVNVTNKIFNVSIEERNLSSGIGEPVPITLNVSNLGIANDTFAISVYNLPSNLSTNEYIIYYSKSNDLKYYVYANQIGKYNFILHLYSTTSPNISYYYNLTLNIRPSLTNDINSIDNGLIEYPEIFEPIYALIDILKRLI